MVSPRWERRRACGLEYRERMKALEAIVEEAAGRIPIYAGTERLQHCNHDRAEPSCESPLGVTDSC